MTQIYVVNGTNGEYSDRTDWNICACLSETRANELADKLRQLQTYNEQFNSRVRTEFDEVYEQANPRPGYHGPDKPSPTERFRQLSSRKKETDEERAEYHRLNKEHLARIAGWEEECRADSQLRNSWYTAFVDAQQVWRKANYNPPEHLQEVVGLSASGRYGVDVIDLVE